LPEKGRGREGRCYDFTLSQVGVGDFTGKFRRNPFHFWFDLYYNFGEWRHENLSRKRWERVFSAILWSGGGVPPDPPLGGEEFYEPLSKILNGRG
jgi:hypothetical protein